MRLGFHISIAGGLSRVVPRAVKLGCETIQFFSRNPRAWRESLFNDAEIEKFRALLAPTAIAPLFVHASYLLNLAAPDEALLTRSINCLASELEQAEQVGAWFVIVHVGNRLHTEEKSALKRVAQTINRAFERAENGVGLLLENTAGQGTELGYTFSHFRSIRRQVDDQKRVGVCLDTAHAFAAGYDLATAPGLDRMLEEVDSVIGIDAVKVLHLNDSKAPFQSKKDRHWHIGKGHIGLSGFANIVNHPALASLPGIIETPRKSDADDRRNLKTVRRLMK